ncbi:hypothetical protein MXF09_23650 [Klebsiella aerogenes]|uniref:hypothetical protein n=1 Tax=Klebsiella aerogenes TaxID=548 RepID=UPI002DB6503A|nr:hypothetical protein [Klebsiella aerogenes]MEB5742692.1 hypothetical protein [Klebsiella aerogenes]HBV9912400.1 hypothetical protein [Klebsiella aerogenes]
MCKFQFYRPVFPDTEKQKYEKLKNAVLNWGGGLASLEIRTKNTAIALQDKEPDIVQLLEDLHRYFHDLGTLLSHLAPEVSGER